MNATAPRTWTLAYTYGAAAQVRAHKASCKRLQGPKVIEAPTPGQVLQAVAATCCKPSAALLSDDQGQAYAASHTTQPGMGCGQGSDGQPCSPAYLCPDCTELLIASTHEAMAQPDAVGGGIAQGISAHATEVDAFLANRPSPAKRAEDGYVPNEAGRRAAVERQGQLDARQAAGKPRRQGRKTGDPRADRAHQAPAAQGGPLAVHAGPAATLDHRGEVAPISASSYPELIDGQLRCLGACGQLLPAARFPFTANKGDGKGRYVECGGCQRTRLAANVQRRAAGQQPLPRPRAER